MLQTVGSYIGILAAILTTASFLPQVITILRTRNTQGISLVMYGMFVFGVFCWLIYGLFIQSWPVIIANLITFILSGSVLLLTIKHNK